jgi:hypothetical protein
VNVKEEIIEMLPELRDSWKRQVSLARSWKRQGRLLL